jgi:hypothetical protein
MVTGANAEIWMGLTADRAMNSKLSPTLSIFDATETQAAPEIHKT